LKKIISAVISVFLVLALLVGCSTEEAVKVYDLNATINNLNSEVVANNNNFELSWNSKGKFVCLYDKKSGEKWSTVPYEYFEEGGTSDNVNSPLNITVANAAKAQWDTVSGHAESVKKDKVSVVKIKNGIEVTYYFDNYLISIPVKYELLEESMKVSVDSSEIVENGDQVLMSVALAPFLCSAKNTIPDSYLFVPSGSGALMYTDERAEGTRKYSAEVYGTDESRLLPEEIVDETKIYLPVYGVKEDNNALFAVISQGAEYAEIYAEAGNRRTEYSTVYPIFYLRGYDVVETDQWLWGYRDLNRISDNKINTQFSVEFYPLSNDQADYNGMVAKYKDYLFGANTDNTSKTNMPMYSLNVLGGVMYKSASFGIPHKELYTLTTFNDTENIIKELNQKTGKNATVLMSGFTSKGIDIGKIGGGFDFPKNYGNKKDLESLFASCEENKAELAFDFDIVRFSSSSGGFSYMFDSAKSATLRTVKRYGINIPLRSYNKEEYRLLRRAELGNAIDKLIDFADNKELTAVGLSTFGSMAYSDYDEEKFSIKGNMASQVVENITKLKKKNIGVHVSDANEYAAVCADTLLNVPQDNGEYFSFDTSIPFYQMVFCGIKPMYSGAINLSGNPEKAVVDAVSSGVRLGFTVAENYDVIFADTQTEKLYGTKYDNTKDTIIKLISDYSELYEKISGCEILKYTISENGISETVFDNGITIFANHNNSKTDTGTGVFEAYEIKITG